MDVIGVGAPVIDRIVHVDEALLNALEIAKGGMRIVDLSTLEAIEQAYRLQTQFTPGGSAANTVKGLAHLGHTSSLVGKIGMDRWGDLFNESVTQLDIKSLYLKSSTPTGQILTLVTPDSERTFCSFPGASVKIKPHELSPSMFTGVKLAHIEGYTLLASGVTEQAMKLAKQAGAKISFDLASFEIVHACKEEIEKLLSGYVDIIFANQEEVFALTGLGPEKACASLKEICGVVVVFCGEAGVWVGQGDKLWFHAAQKVSAIDTTGAGDLFASGFLHGYLHEYPIELCAAYGTFAASEIVQVMGAELPLRAWDKLRSIYSRLQTV